MLDIHIHILPGLDDGSPDMDTSLAMADIALRSGVTRLIVTPHSNQMGRFENFASPSLAADFRRLKEALEAENLPLRIYPGMEIFADLDLKEKIQRGALYGLNRKNYYLVEFPFDAGIEWMNDRIEDMMDCGVIPLIAHVERYYNIQDYPPQVYEWIQMGCRIQINKGSIFGRFGGRCKGCADLLLDHGLVTAVASDAHGINARTPWLRDGYEELERRYGSRAPELLLEENPRHILKGEAIPPHGIRPERRLHFRL